MLDKNLQSDLFPLYKPQPPFMPYQGGYGYMGVILQSAKTGKIQCHICGGMFKSVARHIVHKHDMTDVEYRELTELNKTTPLVCESTSYKLREAYEKLPEIKKEKRIALLVENNKAVHTEGKYRKRTGVRGRVQQKNMFGTCDLQAKHLFWQEYKKQCGIPNLKNNESLRHLVYTRFKSYEDALKTWGISANEIKQYKKQQQIKAYEARKAKNFFPKYDIQDVLRQTRYFYSEHGRLPTWAEARNVGLPSREVYARLFGTKVKTELEALIIN